MNNVIDLAAVQQSEKTIRARVQDQRRRVAVIIPTLNEVDNIVPLLHVLDATLDRFSSEIIFVDDWSSDGTAALIESLAQSRSDIRLLRRHNRRGLASAVVEGMMATAAPVVAVIDADLQHDESILPAMLEAVINGAADIAVGSRYHQDGSCGDWSEHRQQASRLATRLAAIALRTPVSDPLSGFFVARREIVTELAPQLSGKGFKILLDILSSAETPLTIREFPYVFRQRNAGESKLSSAVALDYLRLLAVKGTQRVLGKRLVKFGLVGLAGVAVNLVVLKAALSRMPFASAQTLAVTVAIAFNFLLNNVATYGDRRLRGARLLTGLASFYLVCGLGALANVGVGVALFSTQHRWWLASLAGAVIGSAWNFFASSVVTWRDRPMRAPRGVALKGALS